MEADVEVNCLRLSGSQVPRTHRPANHKANRKRSTHSSLEDESCNVYLTTRVMKHPMTPPNSPLVMQMYSHKKTRESVMKRVQEQTDRVKKKRLVYLKTSSVIEPLPNHYQKSKDVSPRLSQNSDSITNSSRRILPRIDVNNNSKLVGGMKSHTRNKNYDNASSERLRTKQIYRENNEKLCPECDEVSGKSDRKITFDENNNNYFDVDENANDDYDKNEDSDDNDDSKSYDSLAIQSIFVNNCNDDTLSQNDTSWRHRKISKNISWSPLQESYKGYLYKDNGDIVLTRKYRPPSHSSAYAKTRAESNGKPRMYNKMYRWGYMDPGSLLNKQIGTLSITGSRA